MHKSFWDLTDIEPQGWVYESFAYTDSFINHSNSKEWEIAQFDDYKHPQRKGIKKNVKKDFTYIFSSKSKSKIVITNILPFYFSMNVKEISINNNINMPKLIIKNLGNWMYQCDDCNSLENIQWKIIISANDENIIDINEIF